MPDACLPGPIPLSLRRRVTLAPKVVWVGAPCVGLVARRVGEVS